MSVRRYRHRPTEVQAIQYLPGVTCDECCDFVGAPHHEIDCHDDAEFGVETLHGLTWAKPGDFIVRGPDGDFWPCDVDVFAASYEEGPCGSVVGAEAGGVSDGSAAPTRSDLCKCGHSDHHHGGTHGKCRATVYNARGQFVGRCSCKAFHEEPSA